MSTLQKTPIFSTAPQQKKRHGVIERKTGLMKAIIGSSHVMMIGGRPCQFKVRELSLHPDVKHRAVCLLCGMSKDSAEELCEAHPSKEIMEKRNEQHVIALWSDDPISTGELPKGQKPDPLKVLGLLSDEFRPQ